MADKRVEPEYYSHIVRITLPQMKVYFFLMANEKQELLKTFLQQTQLGRY